ncbi:patatin-like phospholipase family protein, partial [Arthrospira platensis SPKY1]|nr:patatin-like phospholipase family protein [Arthrospira platensis SPKY1]
MIMNATLLERIQAPGPKKILACDGGGILGLMSVEIIATIESLLRERQPVEKREDFVLADYFDAFAGTSTGAIIATCLALGMPVARIRSFYR